MNYIVLSLPLSKVPLFNRHIVRHKKIPPLKYNGNHPLSAETFILDS